MVGLLFLGALAAVALDLDHEVEQIILAVAIVDQRGRAQVPAVDQVQVDALADDPSVVGDGRTDDLRGEHERRVIVERCVHVLLGQFDAVALDAPGTGSRRHPDPA